MFEEKNTLKRSGELKQSMIKFVTHRKLLKKLRKRHGGCVSVINSNNMKER